ncbi:MAG: 4Fe-4S dicluster domain-containing protein [Prevotellaceae bacterium]|jgi:ferredoxin|nr:4Fe-4S dicluster domain-containing protein [Prevotellaceae bacterium]
MFLVIKRFRVVFSLILLSGFIWYFGAVRVQVEQGLSLLLHTQFVPALLSSLGASLLVLVAILLLTLLFGRLNCSLLCPLGVFQDVVIRISNLFKTKKQRRFRYTKGVFWLRYSILTLTALLWAVGFTWPLLLLDPYSNFGRMASSLFKPVFYACHNGLHYLWPDTYYFQSYSVGSLLGWILPIAIFVTVVGMSAFRGRLFCNTICPVGSFMGLISKYAAFRPLIDNSGCNRCGRCSFVCKAECIDSKGQQIDHSRCVSCFNCLIACNEKQAVRYVFCWKRPATHPSNRRHFITSLSGLAGTVALYRFVDTKNHQVSNRQTIAPAGARSHEHLKRFCTACQACVAVCPTRIIQPTFRGYGLDGWMLPAINYQNGFCTYNCNRCSQVCPSLALERVPLEEKKLIRIGKARLTLKHCIALKDQTDCGACDEHCPTKAVHMVPFGTQGLRKPVVDDEYCIGCGGCEYICPATPKAIVVEGLPIHERALPPVVEEQHGIEDIDFGF